MDHDRIRHVVDLDPETAKRFARVAALLGVDLDEAIRRTLDAGLASAEIAASAHAARNVSRCPVCGQASFEVRQREAMRLQRCRGCDGVWMDNASAQAFVEAPEESLVADLARDRRAEADAKKPCPVCEQPMAHREFEHLEVRVDLCASHGTWFDRAELFALIPWLQNIRQHVHLDGAAYQEAENVTAAIRSAYDEGERRGRSGWSW